MTIYKILGLSVIGVAAIIIDEKTGVSLGTILTIGGSILGSAWWLGGKLQSLEDGIKEAHESIRGLPCQTERCGFNQKQKSP